jgi:hypothetical protein
MCTYVKTSYVYLCVKKHSTKLFCPSIYFKTNLRLTNNARQYRN